MQELHQYPGLNLGRRAIVDLHDVRNGTAVLLELQREARDPQLDGQRRQKFLRYERQALRVPPQQRVPGIRLGRHVAVRQSRQPLHRAVCLPPGFA